MTRPVLLAAVALLAVTPVVAYSPDWLDASLQRAMPEGGGSADIFILHEERMTEVSRTSASSRHRVAAKILSREGLQSFPLAAAQGVSQDFKMIGGWRVRPDGEVTSYRKNSIHQYDADQTYEFSMTRLNVFKPEDARVGDVIAWEYTLKSKTEAYTTYWRFGWRWPTAMSRVGIKLPGDWKLNTLVKNADGLEPFTNDEGFTVWEMRNLPAFESEPLGASFKEFVPLLLASYGPADGSGNRRYYDSWESVSTWYSDLIDKQVEVDSEIERTVSKLVAGASTELDKIRAVTGFVQGIRYLNVAAGRSTAEPHPAPQILRNRFGDCEDKTVLTIAMLRTLGVPAYAVLALTNDEGSIAPEFPAPDLFNHAITAIRAPESVDLAATVEVEGSGRFIIFDPTDPVTALGDLGQRLQGTRAVMATPDGTGLITLPRLSSAQSTRRSDLAIGFTEAGDLDVKATLTYTGQMAAPARYHYSEVRGERRKQEYLDHLTSHHGKVQLRTLEVSGEEEPSAPLVKRFEITIPFPGKKVGTFRTLPVMFLLDTKARSIPAEERAGSLRLGGRYTEVDRLVVSVPPGWSAVEPFPSARLDSPAGRYSLEVSSAEGFLVVERKLEITEPTLPPQAVEEIKHFFDEVLKADLSSVALERKTP